MTKASDKDLSNVPILSDDQELLRNGICRVPLPPTLDIQKWAQELSQVTPMIMAGEGDGEYAFYRNILDEPDFPFESILNDTSLIGQRIQKHFPIQSLDEIRLDDAFCVHYNMDQYDTSGAKHMDPSDVTINMCLEKSDDTEGSHVLFYGTKKLENVPDSSRNTHNEHQELFLVLQEPGYATIHFGDHPHETISLRKGKRTNIIMTYCYKDPSRSDVATRNCYG